MLAEVRRAIRRIERAGTSFSAPLADALRGGLALLDRERARAGALFERAARYFAAVDMVLHAAVAQRRAAELTDRGPKSSSASEAEQVPSRGEAETGPAQADGDWFATQRIADPQRFTRLFAPIPS
jgi:hypothetical protein